MNPAALAATASQLVADDKGVLAIDESNGTCNQRFAALGIVQGEESRRRWRELIVTTPDLGQSISGIILYDETIRQATSSGRPFVEALRDAGILVGIKVDTGARPLAGFPGESITEGLDGLRQRLQAYSKTGARFAKWRAVFSADDGTPSGRLLDRARVGEGKGPGPDRSGSPVDRSFNGRAGRTAIL